MTISYAIGRNSTEGRAHTMCIEGTQGMVGKEKGATGHASSWGDFGWVGTSWAADLYRDGLAGLANSHSLPSSLQAVRTQNQASQSW